MKTTDKGSQILSESIELFKKLNIKDNPADQPRSFEEVAKTFTWPQMFSPQLNLSLTTPFCDISNKTNKDE